MTGQTPAFLLVLLVAASSCDLQGRSLMTMTEPHPIRAVTAAVDFRLTLGQTERLMPGFDVPALERLLAHVAPERRDEILSYFQKPETNTPRRGMLTRIKDPELQAMLEEVWAPIWDHVGASDAELESNELGLPGREIAIQRRAHDRREKQHR